MSFMFESASCSLLIFKLRPTFFSLPLLAEYKQTMLVRLKTRLILEHHTRALKVKIFWPDFLFNFRGQEKQIIRSCFEQKQ